MVGVGTVLGERYVLREMLARGGMGEVWRADDTAMQRVVAVKTLLPGLSDDPGFATRFRTETRAMAVLSDPAIVELYDFGRTDGVDFIVMQYVEGESLRNLMHRAGPLRADLVMTLVAQAAAALHLAHDQGIVHRDVKPSNLLIRPDGRLVLSDFGIARMVATARVTQAGSVLGTVTYLAPEQITGDPITPATDVYALGVVGYECLAGTPPFTAPTPIAVAMSHTRDEPPPLPEHVPFPVRRVIMRALAKNPADRWPAANAMASAAAKAAAVAAPRPPTVVRPTAAVRRPAPADVPNPPVPAKDAAAADPTDAYAAPADADGTPADADGTPVPGTTEPRPKHRKSRRLLPFGVAMVAALTASAVLLALRGGPTNPAAAVDAAPVANADAGRGAPGDNGAPAVPRAPGDGSPAVASRSTGTNGPIRPNRPAPGNGVAPSAPPTSPTSPASNAPVTATTTAPVPTGTSATTSSPLPTTPARVTLVDFANWREGDAVSSLVTAGLAVDVIHVSSSACLVLSQSPPAGSAVDVGSTVHLTVGSSAECAPA